MTSILILSAEEWLEPERLSYGDSDDPIGYGYGGGYSINDYEEYGGYTYSNGEICEIYLKDRRQEWVWAELEECHAYFEQSDFDIDDDYHSEIEDQTNWSCEEILEDIDNTHELHKLVA
jgi:hypothetical protein